MRLDRVFADVRQSSGIGRAYYLAAFGCGSMRTRLWRVFAERGARVGGTLVYALPSEMCSVFVTLGDLHHLSGWVFFYVRSSMYDWSMEYR